MTERYDAFISYSHVADGRLAPAIQNGLHQLGRRWNERRALNVFRDTTGLAANPGLWTSIREAMDRSRYFVLLASPDAAGSEWVNREVEYWRTTRSADSILPVLTDGEWWWDPATDDFDWSRSSAVPRTLRGAFAEEPRHVDLRWARAETDLSMRHSQFRDQIAELAAPIHGMTKDELEGEDVRRHRSVRRLARAVGTALVTLALVATAAGGLALRNAEEATRAQAEAEAEAARAEAEASRAEAEAVRAEAEATRAQARALASQAELLTAEPDLQLLLHVAALDLDPDPFNQRALLRTLLSRPLVAHWRPDRPGGPSLSRLAAVDPAGRVAVFAGEVDGHDGRVEVWNLERRERLAAGFITVDRDGGGVRISAEPPAGSVPMAITGAAVPSEGTVALAILLGPVVAWEWSSDQLTLVADSCQSTNLPRPMGFSSDLGVAALACETVAADQQTLEYWLEIWAGQATPVVVQLDAPVSDIAVAPDGSMIVLAATAEVDGPPGRIATIQFVEAGTGEALGAVEVPTGGPATIRFSPDGAFLGVGGFDGSVSSIGAANFEMISRAPSHAAPVTELSFSPEGDLLVSGDAAGRIAIFSIADDASTRSSGTLDLADSFTAHGARIQSVGVASDRSFVSVGLDAVGWWNPGTAPGASVLHEARTTWGLATLPDGSIAYGTGEGIVRTSALEPEESSLWLPLEFTVFRLAASADGRHLAGGTVEAHVWDAQSGELIQTFDSVMSLFSFAISPDGELLAAGHPGGGGGVYDVRSGRLVHRLLGESSVEAAAFSPDGRLLAFSQGGFLRVLDVECLRLRAEHRTGASVEALAFSPDAGQLAVGTGVNNGSVVVFEVGDVPPDCGDTTARVMLRERLLFDDPAAGVRSLAFAPDGETLVGGTWDARLLVVDVASGDRVAFIGSPRPTEVTAAVAFTEPGVMVAAGSGGVTRHDWRIESLRGEACRIAGRTLTDAERERYLGAAEIASCSGG